MNNHSNLSWTTQQLLSLGKHQAQAYCLGTILGESDQQEDTRTDAWTDAWTTEKLIRFSKHLSQAYL